MIDWTRVAELREEVGAEDFDEIIEIFLSEVDEAIGALGDGSAPVCEQLHFLKGSALNLGFEAFAAICQKGEAAGNEDVTDDDLASITACYEASRSLFLSEIQDRFAA